MKSKLGFTLVELLIVISLIAILSVAVIATIDPVEQANKARDAQVQNDAAEYLNAVDRYFVSTGKYPWMEYQDGESSENPGFVLSSALNGFGICSNPSTSGSYFDGYSSCSTSNINNLGPLITSGELKSSFANKDIFQKGLNIQKEQLFLTYFQGSISVCYVPKSKTNRNLKTKLKCFAGDLSTIPVGTNCTIPTDNSFYEDICTSCDQATFICVSN
jgi:prepilin-type N-terminal cleavage/methylation domain-containing protein